MHTFGALYAYDNVSNIFNFVSGENYEITDGVEFEVEYPKTVGLLDGHPEIFVSNGSHGNWGAPGEGFEILINCLYLKNICTYL